MWWPGKRRRDLLARLDALVREMQRLQVQGDQTMANMESVKAQLARIEAATTRAVERLGQLADPAGFQDIEDRLRVAADGLEAKVAETDPAPPPVPVIELPPIT